jgi:hypothetical protein
MKVNILNTAHDGKSGNYCGRGSPLGNYAFKEGMTRDEACDAFEVYFRQKVQSGDVVVMNELHRLRNILEETGSVDIRCFCHPKRCHLQTVANWLIDNAFED